MSYYTTVRCKCLVKAEYRQLLAGIINKMPTQISETKNSYIRQILTNGSRFGCFFQDNISGWQEVISEEPIPYFFCPITGEWHFHITINQQFDEIEEFLVRFNPRFLQRVYFLEIYDENSINHFLQERWDDYLITLVIIRDLIDEFGENWLKNIHLEGGF